MLRDGLVCWREGLFLQQHHLQSMQRLVCDQFVAERSLAISYARGLIDCDLDVTDLRGGQVTFRRLHAVMPGGQEVHHPRNVKVRSLNIDADMRLRNADLTVYLAVPKRQASGRNVDAAGASSEGRQTRLPYVAQTQQVEDEVSGGNRQEIETLGLNAWLTVRDDDRHNVEYLPVLKVTSSAVEADGSPSVPREKTDFIPPVMFLEGSRSLVSRVRTLLGSIAEARREILRDLKRHDAAEGVHAKALPPLLRLGHLNAAYGTLSTMLETPGVTPLSLYLRLRETLGRLAAIHCYGAKEDFADDPAKDPFAAPAYQHDDPNQWVFELMRKFNRKVLVGDLSPKFREFVFQPQDRKFFAQLDDKMFKEGKEFYVGVKNPTVDPESYRKVVEDRNLFKLVPEAERSSVGGFGMLLRRVDDPSGDLPTEAGWVFFRVEKETDERRWRSIVSDPSRKVWIFPPTSNVQFLDRASYSFFTLL